MVSGPLCYAAAPRIVRATGIGPHRSRRLPFRDENRYWLAPWKHNERSAERFAAAALDRAAPDGVILPDSTSEYALLLIQRRGAAPGGVSVQHAGSPLPPYDRDGRAFRHALGDRALYVVSPTTGHAPEQLLADAKAGKLSFEPVTQDGQILFHRVRWLPPAQPPGAAAFRPSAHIVTGSVFLSGG